MKYRPEFPARFGCIEDAREFCRVFAWYNEHHRHGGIGPLTPHDVHHGLAHGRVAAGTRVLSVAYDTHPERFTAGRPTPPTQPTAVWINPPAKTQEARQKTQTLAVSFALTSSGRATRAVSCFISQRRSIRSSALTPPLLIH